MRVYNPEGSALRNDQLELVEILKVLAAICQEHGIKWWLSSGTLLGAVRHDGFIPWDDDIDIVMLKDDFRKLEKILCQYESDEYVYHCTKTDVEYCNFYGKFRKKEGDMMENHRRHKYYKWKGNGVDIFAIEKTSYIAARLGKLFYHPLQSLVSRIRIKWLRRPLKLFVEYLNVYLLQPIIRVIGLINPKEEYHYLIGMGWPKHTFYMKYTFPLTEVNFEGEMMPCPKDADSYLTNVYGNWRKIPSDKEIEKAIHNHKYKKDFFGKSE